MNESKRRVVNAAEQHKRSANAIVAKVFRSDRRIRYCAVIDEKSREIAGGMRPGIESLESESESPRLRVQSVIARAMAETWDNFHGKADYMIVHRGKITVFAYFLSDHRLVLVSTEPDYSLQRFQALAELIDKWMPMKNG